MSNARPAISRRRRVLRNLVLLGGGNGAASALALGAVAINSRALPLKDFGTFVLLQTCALLIAGLFTFATQQPVVKLGMAALDGKDFRRFEQIVGLGFLADFASAICAAVSAAAAILLLSDMAGIPPSARSAALIVAGSLAFQGYRTSEGVFRALDRFDSLGALQVVAAAIQLGCALLLWRMDAPFIAYGALAASAIALPSILQMVGALVLLHARSMWPRTGARTTDNEDRREFVAYCGSTWATGSLDTIRMNGDAPLVGLFISVEAAGVYNVARQLAGILRKLVQIYASVLFPELAALAARRDTSGAKRVLRRIVLTTLGLTGVLVTGSAIFGGVTLGLLFGEEFRAGHAVLVLLFAAAGIQLLSATYSMYVQAFDGPVAVFHAYVAATIAFALAIIPGLAFFGIVGAGAAQIVFFAVLTAMCSKRLARVGALGKEYP